MEFELTFYVTFILKFIKFPSKLPIIFLNSIYKLLASLFKMNSVSHNRGLSSSLSLSLSLSLSTYIYIYRERCYFIILYLILQTYNSKDNKLEC